MSARHGGQRTYLAPQQRLTARPDDIQARAPLKQAAFQMLRGEKGERGGRPAKWFWDVCPELKPVDQSIINNGADLRGATWGRLTVVGLLDKSSRGSDGPASWVVRCSCGRFETRTARAIRRKINPDEGCGRCGYVQHLRRQAHFDRTGRWPSDVSGWFA